MNDVTTPVPGDTQNLDDFLGAPPARPWRRRAWWVIGLAVLALAILGLSRCFAGDEEAGYATETVRRGNLTVTVSATGNLQPTNQIDVGSEQSGLVTEVYVENNSRVTKGQVLARLDPSRLRDQITQNEAALAASRAQVATAQASAAQARANLARLEEVFRLSGGRVPSRIELDTGRAENLRAIAGVRSAQAQVRQAEAVLSAAQFNLSRATIYSPVTGVVLSRQVDPGQTVAASFQAPVLFSMAEDLGQMQLEVKVDEADVGQVREGQRATFTVDAYPGRTFPAVIKRVDVGANASGSTTSASSSASSSSSTTAAGSVIAYTAVLSVENPELLLRPGMTATAEIVTSERRNVLLVPNSAMRYSPEREAADAARQSGGVASVLAPPRGRGGRGGAGGRGGREVSIGRGSRQTVYVLGPDGAPQAVRIIVGETNGSETEVASGDLKAGQEVITGRLAPGQTQDRSAKGGRRGDGEGGAGERRGERAFDGARSGGGRQREPVSPTTPEKALGGGTQAPAAPAPGAPPVKSEIGAGAASSERPNPRDMTPEQRRAWRESLSAEERAAMRERREQRRRERGEGTGNDSAAAAPDGG